MVPVPLDGRAIVFVCLHQEDTTLLRALNLLRQEGAIAIETYSSGGMKTRYRKTAP